MYFSIYYKFSNFKEECLENEEIYYGWNSNQKALLKVEKDDEIFVFTGKNDGKKFNVYLLAILVSNKVNVGPKGKYGKYYLKRNKVKSKFFYFDESKPITKLFKKLEFKRGIKPERFGQALQSFQVMRDNDAKLIKGFSKNLKKYSPESGFKGTVEQVKQDDEGNNFFLEFYGKEGGVKIRQHATRERDSKVSKTKKAKFFKDNGRLFCEACEFDFSNKYGKIGQGFIECHHIRPLSSLKTSERTKLNDLVLLCSNCHRMVHRNKKPLTIKKLKNLIQG